MRALYAIGIAAVLAATTPAAADSWKDESNHRYASHAGYGYAPYARHHGEWKQEWREGPCKYERKWERDGDYKEEVKCYRPHQAFPVLVPPSITIIVPIN